MTDYSEFRYSKSLCYLFINYELRENWHGRILPLFIYTFLTAWVTFYAEDVYTEIYLAFPNFVNIGAVQGT